MNRKNSFTLEALASLTGSVWAGDPSFEITGYADLDSAGERDVSFLSNPRYTKTRYLSAMKQSKAGAFFIAPGVDAEPGRNYLINHDPTRAFQTAIEAIRGGVLKRTGFEGIHPTAVIHERAVIGKEVVIGPRAVIDEEAHIGERTFVGAGAYIGPNCRIGEACVIHPNVTIREECTLGKRVVVQAGTVIGSCGFGYTTNEKGEHERLSHIGTVIIEDDVEIGANATIDRSRFTTTRIGRGSKIDNAVVVGHNVCIGRHNMICAQTGIAGSTKTGNHVVFGGQCGVDGHLKLANGVMVTAKSGVTKSLEAGRYGGYPAIPLDQHNRNEVYSRSLEKTVTGLKKRLDHLEDKNSRTDSEKKLG